jgi:hypothetical protein
VTFTPRPSSPAPASAAVATAPVAAPVGGANLSGTYVGQILPEGGGPPFDGRIVIVDRGGVIEITLGPSADELMPATGVKRSGNTLIFEADAPGETPNHLAFEVTVAGNTLTGSLNQARDGQNRKGRLVFAKQ